MTASDARAMPSRQHRFGLRAGLTVLFACAALLVSVSSAIISYDLTRTFLLERRGATARREAYRNARSVRDSLLVDSLEVVGALARAPLDTNSAVVLRVGTPAAPAGVPTAHARSPGAS